MDENHGKEAEVCAVVPGKVNAYWRSRQSLALQRIRSSLHALKRDNDEPWHTCCYDSM